MREPSHGHNILTCTELLVTFGEVGRGCSWDILAARHTDTQIVVHLTILGASTDGTVAVPACNDSSLREILTEMDFITGHRHCCSNAIIIPSVRLPLCLPVELYPLNIVVLLHQQIAHHSVWFLTRGTMLARYICCGLVSVCLSVCVSVTDRRY